MAAAPRDSSIGAKGGTQSTGWAAWRSTAVASGGPRRLAGPGNPPRWVARGSGAGRGAHGADAAFERGLWKSPLAGGATVMPTSPTPAELRAKMRMARTRALTRGTAPSRSRAGRGDALGALLQAGVEDAGILQYAQSVGAATAAVSGRGQGASAAASLAELLGLLSAARQGEGAPSPAGECADAAGVAEALGLLAAPSHCPEAPGALGGPGPLAPPGALEWPDPDSDDEAPPEVDAAPRAVHDRA